MTTSSIDGLVSGLNTTDLISKLMAVEAQPQTDLKTARTAEQTTIASYQSVNATMATLKATADALASTTGWSGTKAASSSDAVTATASIGAATGTTTFDVTSLAAAQVSTLTLSDATTAVGDGSGTLSFTVGTGAAVPVTITTNTPQGVADAINGTSGVGVRASVVTTGDGTTVLQLSARKSGTASAFTVTGLSTGAGVTTPLTDVVAATDAKIVFGGTAADGTVNPGGYTATSSTNTFTGVVNGVTFTANKVATGVGITVTADADGIADKMQAMVDAANAALTEINKQSAYDPTANTSSPLTGDSTVRQLTDRILSAVGNGTSGYGSFKQLGVELDSKGSVTFDRAAFLNAYQTDPSGIQNVISRSADSTTTPAVSAGLAAALSTIGKSATDFTTGSLTTAIQGGNDLIKDMTDRIGDWDLRLASRQEALQKQYANLEVALGKLKDQSTWLSGQLSGLSSSSGSGG